MPIRRTVNKDNNVEDNREHAIYCDDCGIRELRTTVKVGLTFVFLFLGWIYYSQNASINQRTSQQLEFEKKVQSEQQMIKDDTAKLVYEIRSQTTKTSYDVGEMKGMMQTFIATSKMKQELADKERDQNEKQIEETKDRVNRLENKR